MDVIVPPLPRDEGRKKKIIHIPSTPENPIVFRPGEPADFSRFAAAMDDDGSILPFEATGLVVTKNAHLIPKKFKDRDPKIVKRIEDRLEREKKRKSKTEKIKESIINPSVAKPKKNGIVKKTLKAVKRAVKKKSGKPKGS